jgi:hypothetical protein
MQSTGQAATQALSWTSMQDSAMMSGIVGFSTCAARIPLQLRSPTRSSQWAAGAATRCRMAEQPQPTAGAILST